MNPTRSPTFQRIGIGFGILAVVLFGAYSATVKIDFTNYYAAGTQALRGDLDLYPAGVSEEGPLPSVHYFRAAPATAWLFVPFALLPFEAASFVLVVLKVVGLASIVGIVARRMDVSHHRWEIGLGALVAAGGYILEEMRNGNVHLLVFSAIVWALYLVHQGRTVLPAILLAVSIALKVTPALFVVYLACTRRGKVALVTVGMFGALLLLPAIVVGADGNTVLLRGFVSSVARIADMPRNHSLRGAIDRYVTTRAPEAPDYPRVNLANLSEAATTALWLVLAAAVGVLFIAAVRRRSQSPDADLLKDSLVVLAILILSTHTQRIYFSTLFFPYCVLIALLIKHPGHTHARSIRWVIGASVVLSTVAPIVLPGRRLSLAYEMRSPYLFVTLAVFALILVLLRHVDDIPAAALGTRSVGDPEAVGLSAMGPQSAA